jgi:hypothetical protein
MPVCVTIENNPPLGSLLVPRMAQHGLEPKPSRDGEYTRFARRESSADRPSRNGA